MPAKKRTLDEVEAATVAAVANALDEVEAALDEVASTWSTDLEAMAVMSKPHHTTPHHTTAN